MRILIISSGKIPVTLYGGTERVVWSLGKELARLGHQVTFLVAAGSACGFARVIPLDHQRKLTDQIPEDTDLVHFHIPPPELEGQRVPHLVTVHGNWRGNTPDRNAVFVSKNHASRYGSETFVYNGLDWDEYNFPGLNAPGDYFHFLAKAAWKVKNVKGAINVIHRTPKEKLKVLGGSRLSIKMGFRLTLASRVRFYGMVGGRKKYELISGSKGLIFPVTWHEPFGLAIIESLYYGCPVFGTPYGSLPELVTPEVGFLSNSAAALAGAVENSAGFSREKCHEYAAENFSARAMVQSYLPLYDKILEGEPLNEKIPGLQSDHVENLDWISQP